MKKSIVSAAACAISLAACIQQDGVPAHLDQALPTPEQVSIKLPETSARTSGADVLGQTATWYLATRGVTRTFNGGAAWVLTVIHTVVKLPATSIRDNVYTWGPWSEALSPTEYKLDVTAVGDGTYTYQLSGRLKSQANSQFEVVIDGKADPRPGELKGSGEFLIDFDAGRRVNPVDAGDARGSIDAHYDLAQRHLDLTITTTDGGGKPVAASYAYNETTDGGGDMTLAVTANAGGTAALESATLRSRWLATGAGRADARITGGDLGALSITASECWDTAFQRVFYMDQSNLTPTEGSASDCAFATADLPPAP